MGCTMRLSYVCEDACTCGGETVYVYMCSKVIEGISNSFHRKLCASHPVSSHRVHPLLDRDRLLGCHPSRACAPSHHSRVLPPRSRRRGWRPVSWRAPATFGATRAARPRRCESVASQRKITGNPPCMCYKELGGLGGPSTPPPSTLDGVQTPGGEDEPERALSRRNPLKCIL